LKKDEKLLFVKAIYKKKDFKRDNLDFLLVFTKNEEGKKNCLFNPAPTVSIFINKKLPDYDYLPLYVKEDEVDKYRVNYSDFEKFNQIKSILVKKGFIKDFDISHLKIKELKKIFYLNNLVHDADIDIEDYYFSVFRNKFQDFNHHIVISFFDIEVNSSDFDGMVKPETPLAPVIIIGLCLNNNFYSFVYNDKNIKDKDFKKFIEDKNFRKQVREEILKEEDSIEKIHFLIYNDEKLMIESFFSLINETKPEIATAWNIEYDFNYLLNRYSYLSGCETVEEGTDENNFSKISIFTKEARKLVSSKDLIEEGITKIKTEIFNKVDKETNKEKKSLLNEIYSRIKNVRPSSFDNAYFYKDLRTSDFTEKSDYIKTSSYTNYIDQMLVYAQVRKQSKKNSYTLDFISELELKEKKVPLPNNVDIKNLFNEKFIHGLKYNVHDVILLKKLEEKNKDLKLVWMLSQNSGTRLEKVMVKTISERNLARMLSKDFGTILSNNHNLNYTGTKENLSKISGAIVGNPNLIERVGKELLSNVKSDKVFENVIDEDLSAQYPNIINAFLIGLESMVGRIEFPEDKNMEQDSSYDDMEEEVLKINNSNRIVDLFLSRDYIRIGKEFFNLPDFQEIVEAVDDKL